MESDRALKKLERRAGAGEKAASEFIKHQERFARFLVPGQKLENIGKLLNPDNMANQKGLSFSDEEIVAMVLKCHVLAEEVLSAVLADCLEIPELPRDTLTFNNKFKLVKLHLENRTSQKSLDLRKLDAVRKLNDVRNEFSHALHQELNIREIAGQFVSKFEAIDPNQKAKGSFDTRFFRALWNVYFFLVRAKTLSALDRA